MWDLLRAIIKIILGIDAIYSVAQLYDIIP